MPKRNLLLILVLLSAALASFYYLRRAPEGPRYRITELEQLGDGEIWPTSINSDGVVVGHYGVESGTDEITHPFLWTHESGMKNLGFAVGQEGNAKGVNDINDNGQIIGVGKYKGKDAGFILDPVE
ncbi:MAG: hypothetical protein GHCLOJNM_01765 [bacterium]|nr:hypothetical protein [bacterium]